MSPELLNPNLKSHCPTRESDCYALGMVIYEVLSGRTPFFPHRGAIVALSVLDGKRPERPQGAQGIWFTDDMWKMLESSWEAQPDRRPNTKVLLSCLQEAALLSVPSPRPDEDFGRGPYDQLDTTSSDHSTFLCSFEVSNSPSTVVVA